MTFPAASGLISAYFSKGSGVPSSTFSSGPAINTADWAVYQDTATGLLYYWDIFTSAWVAFSSGGGASLLAATYYNPSGGVVTYTLTNAMAVVDTTHLRATFTAPASGNVVVKVGGGKLTPGNANPHIGVMESSTVLGSVTLSIASANNFNRCEGSFYVSGISGGSHNYDLAAGDSNQISASTIKHGFSTSNFADGTGPSFIEVWAAP